MGMEWLPDRLNYYINGELISTYDELSIYGPSFMWLTAVAMPEKYANDDGTFNIDDSKMDENGYFGSSLFKYFRYYQRPLKNVNLLGNPNFEYNRVTSSPYPSTFVLKGNKTASYIQKSPLSYDGFCYHTHQSATPYSLSTGQEFFALIPGKYTFKGQFKADKGINARIVVYDKAGNVLGEAPISQASEWTEVSVTDVEVDGYAYVAVESSSNGGTMLSIDALEFYTQEGEEYTESNTPLYESSLDLEEIPSSLYTLDNAKSATGTWSSSGLESDTYWLTGTVRDVEVTWEIPALETDNYRIELRNLVDPSNTASQNYYITLPDGTEETITVDTKNGETSWLTLGTYPLKEGETIKVSMRAKKQSGNVRITKLRVSKNSDYLSHNSTTIQLNSCIFSHRNAPYAYDKENTALVPYESNGVYYIPYQKLKEVTGYKADIDENSTYVTTNQLENAGIGVTISDINIFLHEKDAVFTQDIIEKALDYFSIFIEPYFPVYAPYAGLNNFAGQIVKNYDEAEYYGTNWTTSNHDITHKYSSSASCFAQWYIDVPISGQYTIDIYSPSHSNSSSSANVYVYANGTRNTSILNQTEKIGWYNLGTFDLEEGEQVKVLMKQLSSSGLMRVGKVRIAPVSAPLFINDKDALNQEYYNHNTATKVGAWQDSGGVYTGCCTTPPTAENKDASIEWNVSPQKNGEYSIQVYVPKYTESGARCAQIELIVDGVTSYHIVNQQADSEENTGNGWYELGKFNLTSKSNVNISITNKTMEGWLRAKAIRLIPTTETPIFANNSDALFQEYFDRDDATKTGTWINSSGVYSGCTSAMYSSTNTLASINWNVAPRKDAKYDIQIFIPKFSADATACAGIDLEISGKTCHFEISEQADSENNPGVGWYSLGSYDLKTTDNVSITMTNVGKNGWLRAKAIRLITDHTPTFVGNFDEQNQELHTYASATKAGTWKASGSGTLKGCYYGSENSKITWSVAPKSSEKYSIQVYIPTYNINASSTTDAYITLTIDGVSHTFKGINQYQDPALWQGWYDLGVFDLTPSSKISVTIGKYSGTFLRAKDMRLVPYPNTVPVTKSGNALTVNVGTLSNYTGSVIFAEFDKEGIMQATQVFDSVPVLNITMQNAENNYKMFFWESMHSMVPVIPAIESN